MHCVVCDPNADRLVHDALEGVELASLGEVLASADYVSQHVPLSDQTRALLGAPELRRMRWTSFLINTARGAVVDEYALARALRRGVHSRSRGRRVR
jgi:phosphoglycerate dehydrogenase-like enzyme